MRKLVLSLLSLLLLAGCAEQPAKPETAEPQKSADPETEVVETDITYNPDIVSEFKPLTIEIDKEQTVHAASSDITVQDEDLITAHIRFSRLPENAAELKQINRKGEDGKFTTVAMLIASYAAWSEGDEETCAEMMAELLNSPTVGTVYNDFTKSFVKERMLQNNKWDYIAAAYFDGAAPENGYTPSEPLTLTLREFAYAPETSTSYGRELEIERIVLDFEGADTERMVSVFCDPEDGNWYIWSDSYKGLLADIKPPVTK